MTIVKKAIFLAAAILCAVLSSCTKEIEQISVTEKVSTLNDIKFNITVADVNPATKAIKKDWAEGDKLNVWFNMSSQEEPDLVLTYDGSEWQTGELREELDADYFNDTEHSQYCTAYYETCNDLGEYAYADGYFTRNVTLGGTDYSGIPMLLAGDSYYSFDGATVTATIGEEAWCYFTDLQVVVTGLDKTKAAQYTLSCPDLPAVSEFTPYPTQMSLTDGAAVAGVSNDDGVAFYFHVKYTTQIDYTFTLTDYTGDTPAKKTYTAADKTLDSGSAQKCVGITIAESKFAAVPAHDYVDLGLSVKWATCNVGASKPEDYGDYFAWGEVAPYYKDGAWSTSTTWGGTSTAKTGYDLSNYCGSSSFTEWSNVPYDASTKVLTSAYDAATANWGSDWRMPTNAELSELLNTSNCNWTWTTENGVNGYKVQSLKEGYTDNYIFLPAAGYRNFSDLDQVGNHGFYRSSSLSEDNSINARCLSFYNNSHDMYSFWRAYGYSVRPVKNETPAPVAADGICFTALEDDCQITLGTWSYNPGNTFKYSTDGINWSEEFNPYVDGDYTFPAEALKTGEKVYLRAVGSRENQQDSEGGCLNFSATADYEVSGNIMYLVDENGGESYTMKEDEFANLFYEDEHIVSAKNLELPASTTKYCYTFMFEKCISLKEAPALPATTLATYCYSEMFDGCTSLEEAPELPATTLAKYCYEYMFYGCTSLKEAPELPAETLANGCYKGMFESCESLETAPELPAQTLAEYCYLEMFNYCTSLTQAPELPAKTLVKSCYKEMFKDCSKLNAVTCLATDGFSTSNCLYQWLDNTAAGSTGILTIDAGASSNWVNGTNYPTNWTIQSAAADVFLSGDFSVSATKKVKFTKGNLWCNSEASPVTWSFEESQTAYPATWDVSHVGLFYWTKDIANSYGSSYSDGTCTTSDKFFADGSDADHMLTVEGKSNLYVLSNDEWTYLCYDRGYSDTYRKYGVTVGSTANCLVIAPDGNTVAIQSSYDSEDDLPSGFVCLPPASRRYYNTIYTDSNGYYWSSSPYGSDASYANFLNFAATYIAPASYGQRLYGQSIRLVSTVSD